MPAAAAVALSAVSLFAFGVYADLSVLGHKLSPTLVHSPAVRFFDAAMNHSHELCFACGIGALLFAAASWRAGPRWLAALVTLVALAAFYNAGTFF